MTEILSKRPIEAETSQKMETVDARQAVAPHRLRYMLVFGTVGAILALAAIYWVFVAG